MGQAIGHGTERFHEGYNVEELIVEYRLLRRVVVEEVEAALGRRTTVEEDIALGMGVDTMLQQGVVVFVNHQRDALRTAADAEAKFMAFLSHDLRNQLNHVSLVLEILTTKLAHMPEFGEDVDKVRAAQRSILETVEGMERLLHAVRLRKGDVEIRCEPVNLLEKITGVVAQFAQAAEEKGIKLAVVVPKNAMVNSDRRMLALILQNLVSNAVKYSEFGTVTIAAAQTNGEWSVAVADEGPGIAPEHRETLFGEFVRAETHGQPGVGLGMAIAWQAAKLIGATLTVESAVGVGTTFRLTLPKC
jgi:signal transduction histidine kinase